MRRKTAHQLFLLAGTVAICLLAAECTVRYVLVAAPHLHVDIYRKSKEGLLLLRPDLARRHVTPQWDVEIRTNSQGRRDHAVPAAPDQAVVLGLGDSQAFGWGVELEESFYSIAERESNVRLIKAAVPGTGPWDYLRTLELLGPQLKPRLAVLAIFVGNDFFDAARGEAGERYEVDDGLLITSGQTVWRDRLARRSHLLQLARAWQFNRLRAEGAAASRSRIWDDSMREFAEIHLRRLTPRAQAGYDKMFLALDEAKQVCDELGIDLALLLVPRSWQVSAQERYALQDALGYADDELDLDRPQREIREWGEGKGVPVWDMPAAMLSGDSGLELFFTPDAHLNPAGHRQIADVLAAGLGRWLRENATIESEPVPAAPDRERYERP